LPASKLMAVALRAYARILDAGSQEDATTA
jgi:hypothetical protein